MMKPKRRINALAFLFVGLIYSIFMGNAHAQLRPMIYADVTVDAPISDVWEDMPEIRPHLTVLQLEFVELGSNQTQVRLFHTGFGRGEKWDEGRRYFEKTWRTVLALYKTKAEK